MKMEENQNKENSQSDENNQNEGEDQEKKNIQVVETNKVAENNQVVEKNQVEAKNRIVKEESYDDQKDQEKKVRSPPTIRRIDEFDFERKLGRVSLIIFKKLSS